MKTNKKLLPIVTPGEVLLEEFLKPNHLSQKKLSEATAIPTSRINEIIKGRRRVSGETSIRLGAYFGMPSDFWLKLQTLCDLETAEREFGERVRMEVQPLQEMAG